MPRIWPTPENPGIAEAGYLLRDAQWDAACGREGLRATEGTEDGEKGAANGGFARIGTDWVYCGERGDRGGGMLDTGGWILGGMRLVAASGDWERGGRKGTDLTAAVRSSPRFGVFAWPWGSGKVAFNSCTGAMCPLSRKSGGGDR